jgi:hypothetical protein
VSEPGRHDERPVDPLFRQQALEEYLRGREHGRLLRVSPWWKHWAFGLLVAAFAGAALFAAWVPLGIDVRAAALVRAVPGEPGALEVVCVLPADALPSLEAGQRVAVDFGGARRARVLLALEPPPAVPLAPAAARAWLGPGVGDVPALDGAVVLAEARLPREQAARIPALAPGRTAVAYVRVGEQSLLRALTLAGVER